MDLKKLQDEVTDRWERQKDNPCHGSSNADHALVHMMKALGKVASALNDSKHLLSSDDPEDPSKYLADLVICATRFAGAMDIDLDKATAARLEEKFPIKMPFFGPKQECSHGVVFDRNAARGLSAAEVQRRWPRGWFSKDNPCPLGCDFVGIAYASYEHYIVGDW